MRKHKACTQSELRSRPTFVAHFADGIVTRMTCHSPDQELDLGAEHQACPCSVFKPDEKSAGADVESFVFSSR